MANDRIVFDLETGERLEDDRQDLRILARPEVVERQPVESDLRLSDIGDVKETALAGRRRRTSVFGQGLRSGIAGIEAGVEGAQAIAAGLASPVIGDDLAERKAAQVRDTQRFAQEVGPEATFQGALRGENVGNFVVGALAQQIPNLAATIGAAVVGGGVGGVLAKRSTQKAIGAKIGQATDRATRFGQAIKTAEAAGDAPRVLALRQAQRQAGEEAVQVLGALRGRLLPAARRRTTELAGGLSAAVAGMGIASGESASFILDPEAEGSVLVRSVAALGGAAGEGVTEAIPAVGILRNIGLGRTGARKLSEAMTQRLGGGQLAEVAVGGARQALSEGLQEVSAEFIMNVAHRTINENIHLLDGEALMQYLEAGVVGALIGGGLGAATSVRFREAGQSVSQLLSRQAEREVVAAEEKFERLDPEQRAQRSLSTDVRLDTAATQALGDLILKGLGTGRRALSRLSPERQQVLRDEVGVALRLLVDPDAVEVGAQQLPSDGGGAPGESQLARARTIVDQIFGDEAGVAEETAALALVRAERFLLDNALANNAPPQVIQRRRARLRRIVDFAYGEDGAPEAAGVGDLQLGARQEVDEEGRQVNVSDESDADPDNVVESSQLGSIREGAAQFNLPMNGEGPNATRSTTNLKTPRLGNIAPVFVNKEGTETSSARQRAEEINKAAAAKRLGEQVRVERAGDVVERVILRDMGGDSDTATNNREAQRLVILEAQAANDRLKSGSKAKRLPGRVVTEERFTPELVQSRPNDVFVFGDNMVGRGQQGQAVIRGLPNAFGIPTKRAPSNASSAFFGQNVEQEKQAITDAVDRLVELQSQGKNIVLPADGLGTGRAQLRDRAPEVAAHLDQQLKRLGDGPTFDQAKEFLNQFELLVEERAPRQVDATDEQALTDADFRVRPSMRLSSIVSREKARADVLQQQGSGALAGEIRARVGRAEALAKRLAPLRREIDRRRATVSAAGRDSRGRTTQRIQGQIAELDAMRAEEEQILTDLKAVRDELRTETGEFIFEATPASGELGASQVAVEGDAAPKGGVLNLVSLTKRMLGGNFRQDPSATSDEASLRAGQRAQQEGSSDAGVNADSVKQALLSGLAALVQRGVQLPAIPADKVIFRSADGRTMTFGDLSARQVAEVEALRAQVAEIQRADPTEGVTRTVSEVQRTPKKKRAKKAKAVKDTAEREAEALRARVATLQSLADKIAKVENAPAFGSKNGGPRWALAAVRRRIAELRGSAAQPDVGAELQQRVALPQKSRFATKDQAKADKASALAKERGGRALFIGQGSAASSTEAYRAAYGPRANVGKYEANDVVFVSAEGRRSGRVSPDLAELERAAEAGAVFVTDRIGRDGEPGTRSSSHNIGEQEVAAFLQSKGYTETQGSGVWLPPDASSLNAKDAAALKELEALERLFSEPKPELREQKKASLRTKINELRQQETSLQLQIRAMELVKELDAAKRRAKLTLGKNPTRTERAAEMLREFAKDEQKLQREFAGENLVDALGQEARVFGEIQSKALDPLVPPWMRRGELDGEPDLFRMLLDGTLGDWLASRGSVRTSREVWRLVREREGSVEKAVAALFSQRPTGASTKKAGGLPEAQKRFLEELAALREAARRLPPVSETSQQRKQEAQLRSNVALLNQAVTEAQSLVASIARGQGVELVEASTNPQTLKDWVNIFIALESRLENVAGASTEARILEAQKQVFDAGFRQWISERAPAASVTQDQWLETLQELSQQRLAVRGTSKPRGQVLTARISATLQEYGAWLRSGAAEGRVSSIPSPSVAENLSNGVKILERELRATKTAAATSVARASKRLEKLKKSLEKTQSELDALRKQREQPRPSAVPGGDRAQELIKAISKGLAKEAPIEFTRGAVIPQAELRVRPSPRLGSRQQIALALDALRHGVVPKSFAGVATQLEELSVILENEVGIPLIRPAHKTDGTVPSTRELSHETAIVQALVAELGTKLQVKVVDWVEYMEVAGTNAAFMARQDGLVHLARDDDGRTTATIWVNETLGAGTNERVGVLYHELGHAIASASTLQATDAEVAAIWSDYRAWVSAQKGRKVSGTVQSKRSLLNLVAYKRGDMRSVQNLSKAERKELLDFQEWFADQVARFMETDTRAQQTAASKAASLKTSSLTRKFFSGLASLIKRLMRTMRNDGAPTESVRRFMDRLWSSERAYPVRRFDMWRRLEQLGNDPELQGRNDPKVIRALVDKISKDAPKELKGLLEVATEQRAQQRIVTAAHLADTATFNIEGFYAALDLVKFFLDPAEKKVLLQALNATPVRAQVLDAVRAMGLDAEEFTSDAYYYAALSYQLWQAGELKLQASASERFNRLHQRVKHVTGALTQFEQAEQIFAALAEGRIALRRSVLRDLAEPSSNMAQGAYLLDIADITRAAELRAGLPDGVSADAVKNVLAADIRFRRMRANKRQALAEDLAAGVFSEGFVDAVRSAGSYAVDPDKQFVLREYIDGKAPTRNMAAAIANSMKIIGNSGFGKLVLGEAVRLRGTKNAALIDVLNILMTDVSSTGRGESMVNRKLQRKGDFENQYFNIVNALTAEQQVQLRDAMQRQTNGAAGGAEVKDAVRKLRALFKRLRSYGLHAGLQIGRNPNYFPWVFDPMITDKNARELMKSWSDGKFGGDWERLARKHKLIGKKEELTHEALQRMISARLDAIRSINNGLVDTTTDPIDMTAQAPAPRVGAMNERELGFLWNKGNKKDRELISKVMSDDINGIMAAYIGQMVKRAEYARAFGAEGEKLERKLSEAKELGATDEEIQLARNAVHSAMGTLGLEVAPFWKAVFRPFNAALRVAPVTRKDGKPFSSMAAAQARLAKMKTGGNIVKVNGGYMIERDLTQNPRRFRQLQAALVTYQNFRLLVFVALTNVADATGIFVRTGDAQAALEGLGSALRETARTWAQRKMTPQERHRARSEMAALAEAIGATEGAVISDTLGQFYGSVFMDGAVKKYNDAFFKWTGMEALMRFTRHAAVVAARRSIINNVQRARDGQQQSIDWLKQIDLDPADVTLDARGELVFLTSDQASDLLDRAGVSIDRALELSKRPHAPQEVLDLARDARVKRALFRMVDESVLRPSSTQRTTWMNDPNWQVFGHLKGFMFAYHERVLRRAYTRLAQGDYTPALYMMAYVPVMMGADLVRELLQFGPEGDDRKERWTMVDRTLDGIHRSGVLGTFNLIPDMMKTASLQKNPLIELGGPTVSQINSWLAVALGGANPGIAATRSLPLHQIVLAAPEWQQWAAGGNAVAPNELGNIARAQQLEDFPFASSIMTGE